MKKRIFAILICFALLCAPCHAEEAGDIVSFRPVDCGIQAQEEYDYPFIGLSFVLPDEMLEMLSSREIFAFTDENYTAEGDIAYALMRFSATTEEQRSQEGMSIDIFAWEAALEKIGCIGIYDQESAEGIDALTLCDTHMYLGESSDGKYTYYISTQSTGDGALLRLLADMEISIGEMHELNLEYGYSAFSENRIEGVANVGEFSTEDVFGNAYTQDVFAEYDLTLVNVFATWCSPCVNEMPELEALRKSLAEEGVCFNVIAVVTDVQTGDGVDEDALSCAQQLVEICDLGFPILIPDSGNMNGRLTGIAAYPESFFVDANGNIVSEAYLGANDMESWQEIVYCEMEALGLK